MDLFSKPVEYDINMYYYFKSRYSMFEFNIIFEYCIYEYVYRGKTHWLTGWTHWLEENKHRKARDFTFYLNEGIM